MLDSVCCTQAGQIPQTLALSGLPTAIVLAVPHQSRGTYVFAARQERESGKRMASTKQRKGPFPGILIA